MSSAKKKPTKRPAAKAPARKAAPPKGAAPPARSKKAAKAPARREPAAPAPAPAPAAPATRSRGGSSKAQSAARAPAAGGAHGRLGAKWICFKCGAKFYDLNKPEPLCPKCGANQNERPKRDPKPKAPVVEAPPPRPVEPDRDMIPIEEDDEGDALLMEDEEIDLGAPELDGEAEAFGEEEEEEEPGDV